MFAFDFIEELDPGTALRRRNLHDHTTELVATARRLFCVREINLDRLRERLAIGNLRSANSRLDLKFALQAVDEVLKLKLACAFHDRLAKLVVSGEVQAGILGS
jgi:hypothetical protein